jgi:hypothetical protein
MSMPRKARRAAVALGGALSLLAICIGVTVAATSSATFGFTGDPPGPQPFSDPNWDVQVHSRDVWTATELESMEAAHGPDCGAPPATHAVSHYKDAVFICKNHVMTAMNATGYGVIYLTPNVIADFSTGEAVISWDMSTLRASDRDWVDVWITPWEDNMALPLESWTPDLTGNPTNAIHVRMDGSGTAGPLDGRFRIFVIKDGVETNYGLSHNYNDFLVQDAARRDKFELHISKTRIRLLMPGYNQVLADETIPALNWSTGIVQWGHHSYNPKKGFAPNAGPGTWHWDNMSVSPAIPFTMIHADRRYTNNGTVNFSAPAPADAFLRFAAQGGTVEVNDGSGFRTVQPQQPGDGFEAASFFVPIRQGASSVQIRMSKADSWFQGPFFAKDFTIWAQGAGQGQPTPSPTSPAPTVTPTKTPTPSGSVPSGTASAPNTPTPLPPTSTPTSPPPPSASDSRISWGGSNWYLHGANLPWYNWSCDFGCGSSSGASSSSVREALDARFALARTAGVKNIRWWMFEGDAWQITRDSNGAPSGINAAVFTDIDAALALADKYDLYYDFVLFSSPTAIPSSWVNDAGQRAKLAQVLGTLFAQYQNHPRIVSWEVFNEPEWDIWNGKANQASVQSTVKSVVDSVHANSSAKATVGSAMLDGLGMWVGLGLDYYRAHWYDYMSSGNWCAMCTDYSSVRDKYRLDRPRVIGEMYAGSDVGALSRFEQFYDKGYAGAFAWSLFPERTSDAMAMDLTGSQLFAGSHTEVGPKNVGGTTTPTATPTATPRTPTPTSSPTTPAPTVTPTTVPSTPTPTVTTKPSFAVSVKTSVRKSWFSSKVTISADVLASQSTKGLVAVQVHGPTGTMLLQKVYDNQSFTAGQSKDFTFSVNASQTSRGTYTVKVGIWEPGWGSLLKWVDPAATFTLR